MASARTRAKSVREFAVDGDSLETTSEKNKRGEDARDFGEFQLVGIRVIHTDYQRKVVTPPNGVAGLC
ncbi:MAG: hypothetical protein WA857_16100 [Candidatus Acidiferrum sp.]